MGWVDPFRLQPVQHPLVQPLIMKLEPAFALLRMLGQDILEAPKCALTPNSNLQEFLQMGLRDSLNEGFHIFIALSRISLRNLDKPAVELEFDQGRVAQ